MSKNNDNHYLNSRQSEIYLGLKSIGPEIAAFYMDGIKILNTSNLQSKSYLLGHLAREIEGGIRDAFVIKMDIKQICKDCKKPLIQQNHIDEICVALGIKKKDSFAEEWHKVANQFHKFAHRQGPWKEPRSSKEIEELWTQFEEIMLKLVGNYLNIINRIDLIVNYEKPTRPILNTLKNLLSNPSRYSYFFKNLKSSQWLIPLFEEGYFNPEAIPKPKEDSSNPGFYYLPRWDAFIYLEKIAKEYDNLKDSEVLNTLIIIVESLIRYRKEDSRSTDNYHVDSSIINIYSYFPINKIKRQYIDFIGLILKSSWDNSFITARIAETIFAKIIEEKSMRHILWFLTIWLRFIKDKQTAEFQSIADKYWFNKSLKRFKKEIFNIGEFDAYKIVLKTIAKIINKDSSQFNTVWIPAIEDHPQTHFPDRFECQLVYLIRDYLEILDDERLRNKVDVLIKAKHPIYKRIAFHLINVRYNHLENILWSLEQNPLDEVDCKHELYELIKKHAKEFKSEQISKLINWIEIKDYGNYQSEEKYIALLKKEWLKPLRSTKDERVIDLYEKYDQINPAKKDHPGFDFWMETKVGHESPFTVEELKAMSHKKIVNCLNSFEMKNQYVEPSEEGLRRVFQKVVSDKPSNISENINEYFDLKIGYQVSLIDGLLDGWKAGKNLDWKSALNFIYRIINRDSFWRNNDKKERYNYKRWFVNSVADLITEGTRHDNHAFEPSYLLLSEKILLLLANKAESMVNDSDDIINAVLNSTKGRVFQAMMNYSLRYGRVYRKNKKSRWKESIKNDIEKRLDSDKSPEFWITIAQYLHNLLWLDHTWTIKNFGRIFNIKKENEWRYSISSYFFFAGGVNEEIFNLMKKGGHFSKALETQFSNKEIKSALIDHITNAYLEGFDTIEDKNSLINKLFTIKNPEFINEMILFIWHSKKNIVDEQKRRIYPLWEKILTVLTPNINKLPYQKIASDLSLWLSLVDNLDKRLLKWIKFIVPYVEVKHRSSFFVEYLRNHVEKTPDYVAQIYIEMLNNKIVPTYKKENIIDTVNNLYSSNLNSYANQICNLYAESDQYFLRAIYEKNRN